MVRAPRFCTFCRAGESFGQVVQCLEYQFARNVTFIFGEDFVAKILFEIFTDNENEFAETGANGIVDGIIHDCFTIRTQSVQLFQASITASHSGSQ